MKTATSRQLCRHFFFLFLQHELLYLLLLCCDIWNETPLIISSHVNRAKVAVSQKVLTKVIELLIEKIIKAAQTIWNGEKVLASLMLYLLIFAFSHSRYFPFHFFFFVIPVTQDMYVQFEILMSFLEWQCWGR